LYIRRAVELEEKYTKITQEQIRALPAEYKTNIYITFKGRRSMDEWKFVNDEQLLALPAGFELNIRSSDVENLESWKYYDDELRKDLNRLFEEFEHQQDLEDDDPDNTALNSLADADEQLTLAEQWSRVCSWSRCLLLSQF
jgi:hypothetical protein